jgi:hypothetical protein
MLTMKLETLGVTTLARINKILDAVKLHSKDKDEESVEITMEFLVGSLFPELFKNFQAKISEEYQRGFREGYKARQISDFEDMMIGIEKIIQDRPDNEADLKELQTVLYKISEGMGIEFNETN